MNNPNNTLAYKQYVLDEIAKIGSGGLTAEEVQAMIDAALANLPAPEVLEDLSEVAF